MSAYDDGDSRAAHVLAVVVAGAMLAWGLIAGSVAWWVSR